MSGNFNAAEFHERVFDVVRLIPRGRVTTYGHVAKLAGFPGYARAVGAALKGLPSDPSVYATNLEGDAIEDQGLLGDGDDAPLPWQRVLSSGGWIAERGADGGVGADRQSSILQAEGVDIIEPRGGGVSTVRGARLRVPLYGDEGYGWFPNSVRLSASPEQQEPVAPPQQPRARLARSPPTRPPTRPPIEPLLAVVAQSAENQHSPAHETLTSQTRSSAQTLKLPDSPNHDSSSTAPRRSKRIRMRAPSA